MRNKVIIGWAAGLLAISSTPAMAGPKSGAQTAISLTVPESCSIEADPLVVEANGGMATGSVLEFCNGGGGYQIVASHRPLSENEAIRFAYDGTFAPAARDGMTAIASRYGATFRRVPISLAADKLERSFAISLTLMAI